MTNAADDGSPERADGPSNVLLLDTSDARRIDATCAELLDSEPARTNVLSVNLDDSSDDGRGFWHERVGGPDPAETALVTVATPDAGASTRPASRSVEHLERPGDLIGLGVAISDTLRRWQANRNRSLMCFRSVTLLLDHATLERTFRFLHLLTHRVDAVGATARYHLDVAAHDVATINTLVGLFDAVR